MVDHLRDKYQASERHACRVLLMARGTYRYQGHSEPWTELRMRIREIPQSRWATVIAKSACYKSNGPQKGTSDQNSARSKQHSRFKSGAGFGAGLYCDLVRFGAVPCEVEIWYMLLHIGDLCATAQRGAGQCLNLKIGLKIRGPQGCGGSSPFIRTSLMMIEGFTSQVAGGQLASRSAVAES